MSPTLRRARILGALARMLALADTVSFDFDLYPRPYDHRGAV